VPNEYDIALNNITLEQYINQFVFRKIPLRSTFLEVNHLIQCYVNINNPTLDNLFLYCEILYGIFTQGMNEIIAEPNIAQQYAVIIENIMIILEKTNHEFIQKADNQYIIVEKNKTATQAANIVTDDTVSLQILEYNHYSLKGNLEKKRQILDAIGQCIEPILKSNKLRENGYSTLQFDAGFLLNNFHIRHNNKEGKNKQDYIASIDDAVLETWYDKAYNTLLMVIIANEQIDIQLELAQIKRDYQRKS